MKIEIDVGQDSGAIPASGIPRAVGVSFKTLSYDGWRRGHFFVPLEVVRRALAIATSLA